MKKSNNLIQAVGFFLCLITIIKCDSKKVTDSKYEIIDALGLKKDYGMSNCQYKKINLTPDYETPYNLYMTCRINEEEFKNFKYDLGLISYKNPDSENLLCLNNPESFFRTNFFWEFEAFNIPSDSPTIEIIPWWNINVKDKTTLYGAYYNDNSNSYLKIVSCEKNWNGRILVQYRDGNVLIFVERL